MSADSWTYSSSSEGTCSADSMATDDAGDELRGGRLGASDESIRGKVISVTGSGSETETKRFQEFVGSYPQYGSLSTSMYAF